MKCTICGKKEATHGVFCEDCNKIRMQQQKNTTTGSDKGIYSMKATGDTAEILIYQDIGFWGLTADQFAKDLAGLGKVKNITLKINSYGGEVFDGFAIYNMLKEHPASKSVVVMGIAASISSVIAMSADKGKLSAHDNAQLMIHDPSVMVAGTSADLRNLATVLDAMKESAIRAYQMHATGLGRNELWDMMSKDSYLTAKQAKDKGLVDEVLDSVTIDEPVTNTGRSIPEDIKGKIFNLIHVGQVPTNQGVAMVKCKHCGKDIAEGVVFCNHCGHTQTEPVVAPANASAAQKVEIEAARIAERTRCDEISARCDALKLPVTLKNDLIKQGVSLEDALKKITDEMVKLAGVAPVGPDPIKVAVDEADKFRTHAINSLSLISGVDKTPEMVAKVKTGGEAITSLHGLMRRCLQRNGIDCTNFGSDRLVEQTIKMQGTGSSDFPYILADVANKVLLKGFENAPVTYPLWTGVREVPDFKTVHLIKMSSFSGVYDLPEGADMKEGKFSDKEETTAITTKGVKFTMSRKAMINDDLSALTRIPASIGMAVARRINTDLYDALTYNSLVGHVMSEDSVALFNESSHVNAKTSSGVPSVASIGVADARLLNTKLPKPVPGAVQQYAGYPGKFIITGPANRMTLLQIIHSTFDPAGGTGAIPGVFNPYSGTLTPVIDAYLGNLLSTASKANAWYLATDPTAMEHFEIVYLQGQRAPQLRGAPSAIGDALGFVWDLFFDWAIANPDWRGINYNDGAA